MTIMTMGKELLDQNIRQFLDRIQESHGIPLKDPFIHADGEDYLFLLTAAARDALRLQGSIQRLLDLMLEERKTEAHKVNKMKPPKDSVKINVQELDERDWFDDEEELDPRDI